VTDRSSLPTVVVLGASGFLGSAITRQLSRRPIRLRAVARRPASVPTGGTAKVEVCQADLTVASSLANVVAGADAIVHLLLYDSGASWRVEEGDLAGERVNAGVARDLVEVLRASGRRRVPPVVVFAGSTSQVGVLATARIDGTESDDPVTEYDRQKLAAEHTFMAATTEGMVRGITLRLATLFGHSSTSRNVDRGVVAAMIRKALAGEPLTMWNDGTVGRDLLYLDDAVAAFLAALDHPDALAGRHWLIGAGHAVSIADLFGEIAATVAIHTGQPPVPVVSVPPPEHATSADFQSFVSDPSAFQQATGWQPRVPLREALRRTVAALAGR
jgi:nucleoside-diphosphate-sugar epimerase